MIHTAGVGNYKAAPQQQSPGNPRELSAEELRFSPQIDWLFASSQELSGTNEFVGQEHALVALELGLGVLGNRYNSFVSRLTRNWRLASMERQS